MLENKSGGQHDLDPLARPLAATNSLTLVAASNHFIMPSTPAKCIQASTSKCPFKVVMCLSLGVGEHIEPAGKVGSRSSWMSLRDCYCGVDSLCLCLPL